MQLTELKGVSEKRELQFKKLGIESCEELVRHFPRDYCDLTHIIPINEAYHNDMVLTKARVLNVEVNRYARRPFVKALCEQGKSFFTIIWFNQLYVSAKLQPEEYLFYGRVQNRYGMGCQLVNPTFEEAASNTSLKGIIPVYALSEGLSQKVVRSAIRQALFKSKIESAIPWQLQKKYELADLKGAYLRVHNPSSMQDYREGAERIALEEYFLLVTAFVMVKGDREEVRRNVYTAGKEDAEQFEKRFPFAFTEGQRSAIADIVGDLHSPHRMNRLLQGDVGCGKTAVALTGIFLAVKSGYQAVMLAPTEVLARQNYQLISQYLPDYPVAFLAGTTPATQKREIKKGLKDGTIAVVCGTHAVIQKDVEFCNLGFAVCDEQHRFGVAQRSSLSDKGDGCDVLIMSATPIPRTLSLIVYGDLDITTITDKPRARQEISTSIIPPSKYPDMYRYITEQAALGRQTYFVCPKIEGDDEGTVMSVTELYEDLQAKMPRLKIGLLHGKMKDKQKEEVMASFKAKQYDCLVSTTVIEVGVDVPDATIMVIYNAERFGLSQLHQLRGRVGRGNVKSYCFLLTGSDSDTARERLSVLKNNSDGFRIAEMDLQMRGGGDFMGTRQSGRMLMELKNLKFPASVIFTAKALADEALSGQYDNTALRKAAMEKYDSLKDVVLN
jgi:ATP-dependent DNA helicase RecG